MGGGGGEGGGGSGGCGDPKSVARDPGAPDPGAAIRLGGKRMCGGAGERRAMSDKHRTQEVGGSGVAYSTLAGKPAASNKKNPRTSPGNEWVGMASRGNGWAPDGPGWENPLTSQTAHLIPHRPSPLQQVRPLHSIS